MIHLVRAGETASSIARRYTGDARRWLELAHVNAARDWHTLYPGEEIILPPGWHRGVGSVGNAVSMTLAEARRITHWLTDADFATITAIARKCNMRPIDLLLVLFHESGVKPWIASTRSSAAGLMQWVEEYRPPGVSRAQLLAMTATQQLRYVDSWFSGYARAVGGRPWTRGMTYAVVLCPGRLTPQANDATIAYDSKRHEEQYKANRHLDGDNDGVIRLGDIARVLDADERKASFVPFAVRLAAAGGATPAGGGAGDGVSAAVASVGGGSFAAVVALVGAAAVYAAWRYT